MLKGVALAGFLATLATARADLVAFWEFNQPASLGYSIDTRAGRPGNLRGGAALTADAGGRTSLAGDHAVQFGTAGQNMHMANASFITAAAAGDALSVSFWIKQNAIRNSSVLSFVLPASTGARGFQAHTPWSDSNIYFDTGGCCDGFLNRINTSGFVADWSSWRHVALIKNLDAKEIWVDGVLIANGSNTDSVAGEFSEMFLGNAPNLGEAVNGAVDDFAIFSHGLTADEVASLAAGGSPLALASSVPNDSDGDTLPDKWELSFFAALNQLNGGAADFDSDGSSNVAELARGTRPNVTDTDGDGLSDGVETATGVWVSASNTGTNPLVADTDLDGLADGVETRTGVYVSASNTGTDPLVRDTDNDLVDDGAEVLYGSSPVNTASTPVTPGVPTLLAWWQFNNDSNPAVALDTKVGHTGQLINGAAYTADAEGVTGAAGDKAVRFAPGSLGGQKLTVANANWLNMATRIDKLTVSFWQKLDSTPASSSFWFYSPSANSTFRGFQAHVPWENNVIYYDSAGCCDPPQRLNGGPPGGHDWTIWHHYVFLKDGTSKKVYIDGVEILSGGNAAALQQDFNSLVIGSDLAVNPINGVIDEFSVFAAALNSQDISDLAARTKTPAQISNSADADADGLPDAWEYLYFPADLTKLNASPADFDSDGSTDAQELTGLTVPNDSDTDDDGLLDGVETKTGTWVSASNTGTDPKKADTDGDGLPDGLENNSGTYVSLTNTGTNPNLADTDGDGFRDAQEGIYGANPNIASSRPFAPGQTFLLAHWPFNDAADATVANDVVAGIAGVSTGSYTDDGFGRSLSPGDRALNVDPNQSVKVDGSFMNLASAGDSISISFWQKLDTMLSSSSFWVHSTSVVDRGIQAHVPWGDGNIYFDHGGCCVDGVNRLAGLLTADFTQWNHYAFIKNGTVKQVWVNGALLLDGTGTAPLPTDLAQLFIGSGFDTYYADGQIDDFAVYAGGLTEEQITRLALGESPSAVLLPPTTSFLITNVVRNGNGTVSLTWNSEAGAVYAVQSSTTLAADSWSPLSSNILSGGATTSVIVTPPAGAKVFLRIVK